MSTKLRDCLTQKQFAALFDAKPENETVGHRDGGRRQMSVALQRWVMNEEVYDITQMRTGQ